MLNHIVIMGRLTRDPELRYTQSQIPVASFSLAVDRDFGGRDGGERQTDFIFCVCGEELGFIGCLLVIVLLLIIIIRCVMVGIRSGSNMGSLVCFGVAAFLTFQTFENIGMCIGITPVIGITLPFFSYGGSSLFTTFAALGMVSGIHFRPRPKRNSIYY